MNLFKYLESFSWAIGSLIVVAAFVLFTIAGILIVRKFGNISRLKAHHDVTGFIFTNLGVLYAVLLGFTTVNVQQRFDKMKDLSQMEGSYLDELYRDAAAFSAPDTEKIRTAILVYGKSIVYNEWDTMKQGQPSFESTDDLNNLWNTFYSIEPSNPKQEIWYSQSITKLNQLIEIRMSRLVGSVESLGPEMWTFLILDGIAIMAFMWFFGPESLTLHLIMSSIFAASAAFLLFLVYSLDTSFSGSTSIAPEAVTRVLRLFNK